MATPLDEKDVLAFLRGELNEIKPVLRDDTPLTAQFRSDLSFDSLDLVELVARIERRYELMIPDEDLPEFVSLAATIRYILGRARP